MDHVGLLAKTAKDTAIALNTLAKLDPKDPDSVKTKQKDYTRGLDKEIKNIRIGIPKDFIWDLVDTEVQLAFNKALKEIESLGAIIKEIVNPNLELINMAGSIVQTSEAATIHRSNVLANGSSFDPVIRMRIETGLFITADSYIKAQQVRMDEKAKLIKQFDEVDLIATPTTSIAAPYLDQERIEINGHDVHIREALLRITRVFSTIGLPAISIPCGFTENKLPIGLQLVAKPFNEQLLLNAAHCFQKVTNWHNLRPTLDNDKLIG
jgi:Asp-tRNA(Asn)/Glu-tRNA(Gln) amidotransferase A subunit family amidase